MKGDIIDIAREQGAKRALREFADLLDKRRPSAVQSEVGDVGFNKGAVNALKWAAAEARKIAEGRS